MSEQMPTRDQWVQQFYGATNRMPTDQEVGQAAQQGYFHADNYQQQAQFNTGVPQQPGYPPMPPQQAMGYPHPMYTTLPSGGVSPNRIFSFVAFGSLLLGFVALLMPVASVWGQSLSWFDDEMSGEGAFVIIALILSAIFVTVQMLRKTIAWRIIAAIILAITGAILMYDGFKNMSELGEFAGSGLIIMGLAGVAAAVSAIGILVSKR